MRPLSLAPASVADLSAAEVVECAAAAGFSQVGVRPTDVVSDVPAVAEALRRTGVELLEFEYVRIVPGPLADEQLRTVDAAAALGARFLLVVSDDPDRGATAAKLAALVERLAGAATTLALEFMAFTQVRRLADAVAIARQVPGVTVLPDPLHLVRTGDAVDELAATDPGLIGYAQLCDAPAVPAATDPAALAEEARHRRLPPGHGSLPLVGFLAALPDGVPVSVEVQSDQLREQLAPIERARLLRKAAEALLNDGSNEGG